MSKTITDEEYERLAKRDKQVDDYCEEYRGGYSSWVPRFQQTAKPRQYRPTLDELIAVYIQGACIDRLTVAPRCREGLKAVIDKVFEGMQDEYDNQDQDTMFIVADRHREGYKED